jgi:hypothetical protein
MNRTWQIRPYRDGDAAGILQLRKIVFGDIDPVRSDMAAWSWQFQNNPAGHGWIFLAEDSGNVVGQYAAIPTRMLWNGRKQVCAFSCDTMTHPDYRHQGMFAALADELYHFISHKHHIHTVWGFPNDQSLPGFARRLNWNIITRYPLTIIPLRPLRMLTTFIRYNRRSERLPAEKSIRSQSEPFNILPELDIVPIREFSDDFDIIWNRYKPLSRIVQIRDSRYLNWRYAALPEFGYASFAIHYRHQPAGYLVIRLMTVKGHYFGALMDIFPLPLIDDRITIHLLKFVRRYCRINGAEFAAFLLPGAVQKQLRRLGAITIPKTIDPKPWHLGCRNPVNHEGRHPEDWHITYGDADIL